MASSRPKCPKCRHDRVVKNGHVRGNQRWKCKNCTYEFTRLTLRGVPPNIKLLAIMLYLASKSSYRAISELLNISSVSIHKWVQDFHGQLPVQKSNSSMNDISAKELIDLLNTISLKNEEYSGVSIISLESHSDLSVFLVLLDPQS